MERLTMSADASRLSIPAGLSAIPMITDFVVQRAQAAGLDDEAIYHCRLSVEEIFTNIVEHGYMNSTGGIVEVICRLSDKNFSITLIDDAPAFDPLALPDPDPSVPLWERQGGGWGIYFVKKFMDRVEYHYQANRNMLLMEKRLSA
jgi:anti-sigma regulatory factor (Ser/Thr protein kinase)